ncbi:MAG: MBL fold metallo-hydrolase [Mesorhizobium sp.]|nr:MAG: MBL fold metallo-hydrolase [Mesorhizobium sp.]
MHVVLLAALVISLVTCLPARTQEDLNFPYVNDDGEEVFGSGYLPQSAADQSQPLYMARPNAGVQIPDDLLLFSQEAFRPNPQDFSLPVDPSPRQMPSEVPLLREIRRQFTPSQIPRLEPSRPSVPKISAATAAEMRVHYVFVGQGAGAIVELPCGVAVVDLGGEYGGGEAKVDGGALFVDYLKRFFDQHPQYHKTIDTLILSHPHADHINGITALKASGVTVRALVDNGQSGNQASLKKQTDFRDWVRDHGGQYTAVELSRQFTATGVTSAAIDPFDCATISAFWGGANELLPKAGYENPNNHSVLLRIDFGQASFLFLGDLQDQGAADLLTQYEENLGAFDVDVFQVAYHGADGDTTDDLLDVLSPRIAVISMGTKESKAPSTAWDHGHPRLKTLKILQEDPVIVADRRDPVAHFWGAPAQESDFEDLSIPRAIFGTGWEGTVIVRATKAGEYHVSQLGFR